MGEVGDFMAGEQANVLAVELLAQGAGQTRRVDRTFKRAGNDAGKAVEASITRAHVGLEWHLAQGVFQGFVEHGKRISASCQTCGVTECLHGAAVAVAEGVVSPRLTQGLQTFPSHVDERHSVLCAELMPVFKQFGRTAKTGKSRVSRGGASHGGPVDDQHAPIGMAFAQAQRSAHAHKPASDDHGIQVLEPTLCLPVTETRGATWMVWA